MLVGETLVSVATTEHLNKVTPVAVGRILGGTLIAVVAREVVAARAARHQHLTIGQDGCQEVLIRRGNGPAGVQAPDWRWVEMIIHPSP